MCMEDVRLGREAGVAVTTVTLVAAGTVGEVCKADLTRTHLSVWSSNRRNCSIAPKGITPSAAAGIAICYNATPVTDLAHVQTDAIEIDIQTHGLLVTQPWSGAATDAADAILMVSETFIHKS